MMRMLQSSCDERKVNYDKLRKEIVRKFWYGTSAIIAFNASEAGVFCDCAFAAMVEQGRNVGTIERIECTQYL